MENETDYLTKENREYFKDRPIYNSMCKNFREKMLPLYERTLVDDEEINDEAETSLQEIYRIKGYQSKGIYS